ncbi:MAG TPA: SWIM zinc finger family protein, partial [Clostridia bacterium]|nr:SWIM zinc finger family protein [Clostridia bacterium]
MGMWSIDQVLALAPDASSVKAGQSLGRPGKWLEFGHDSRALWGQIQGSGKNPYRTQVDLTGPAFHCSCPSRKFPCKHGLGLMLVFAAQPDQVPKVSPPPWVAEWIAKRDSSAERKAAKAQAADATPEDPEVALKREKERARRAAKREDRVREGMEEFQVWLDDTARHGLAHARQHAARSWDVMAARLVDAQAPGVARLVQEMAGLAVVGDEWTERLLERLSLLQLLAIA